MKKITLLLAMAGLLILCPGGVTKAQNPAEQKLKDSIEKVKADSIANVKKVLADIAKDKEAKDPADKDKEAEKKGASNETKSKIAIGFFIVMLLLLILFFIHLYRHNQRIGFQSIKLIGLILIFPGICILALIGGTEILGGQTLAALFGTIAGYVLSREDDPNKDTSPDATLFRKKIKALTEKIEKAENDIKAADDAKTPKTDPAYIRLEDELKKLLAELTTLTKTA